MFVTPLLTVSRWVFQHSHGRHQQERLSESPSAHTHTHAHMHAHMYTHTHTHTINTHMHTHTDAHTHAHTCTQTTTHTHVHTHTHTQPHTHMAHLASYTPSSQELANEEHSIHDEVCDTQNKLESRNDGNYCRIANLILHYSAIISAIPRYFAFIPRRTHLLPSSSCIIFSAVQFALNLLGTYVFFFDSGTITWNQVAIVV